MAEGRSLRVLHVMFSLDAGGMENGVVNVSRALEGRGFEMHACCLARGGKFVERFPRPDCVRVLGKGEGFSPRTILQLARHIARTKADVIHTHNFGPLIYAVMASGGVNRRILHGEHAELTAGELVARRLCLRRGLYRQVGRVHTVSRGLRDSLAGQGLPADKIEIVVNGVDTGRFTPGARDEARAITGMPRSAVMIGLVGRFGEFKGHGALIEAFERLPRNDAHLVFIGGGGPLEDRIRLKAEASAAAARIHFAGFQSDLLPWYRALDLLVIPSTNEGLSNALLEAMACGIPSLLHPACGSREVVEDGVNGFIRDLSSPAALHAALEQVLNSPEKLPIIGAAARETVTSKFSFASMVAGYERLYRELAHV